MTKRETPKPKEDKRERALFLYLGVYSGVKEKKLSGWLQVSVEDINNCNAPDQPSGGNDDRFRVFAYKVRNHMWASIGEIYEIPIADGGNSIYSQDGKHWGSWKNKEQVVFWSARSEALESALNAEGKMKSIGRSKPLKEYLEPITRAYKEANGLQKSQLLAQVVKYVTGRS